MADQDHWLQRVRYTAAEPSSWLLHARTLRQAAEDLWRAGNAHAKTPGSELGATVLVSWKSPDAPEMPDTGGSTREVCFMLFGYALENLVKGIIVCRDPTLVTEKRLRRWDKRGHRLIALFADAGIQLDESELNLLGRVTRMTEWKGRYPVPLDFSKTDPQSDAVIGSLVVTSRWPVEDYEGLVDIYEKTVVELKRTMSENPPLPADHDFGTSVKK